MQTYIRVVESGSITNAAEQMNTVKSAVSKRLTELEKHLGVTLINRTTRTQTLTDAGRIYYQQCLKILDDVDELESNLQCVHGGLRGRIKLAAPLSFGLAHLSTPIRQFNEIHPDIQFDIDFSDRKVDIVEDGFDLAIRISTLTDSTLIAKKISSTKGILCASKAYLANYGEIKTVADIHEGHCQLKYITAPDAWTFNDESGVPHTIKLPVKMTTNNGDFLMQAAVDGMGLLYTPDFICYKAIKAGQLVPLLKDLVFREPIGVYAIYPQTRYLSHRVRQFIDFLNQFYGETPYWSLN